MRKLLAIFCVVIGWFILVDAASQETPYVLYEDEEEAKNVINQSPKLSRSGALIFQQLSLASHFSSLEVKDQEYFQELLTQKVSQEEVRGIFLYAANLGCEGVMGSIITYSVAEGFPSGVIINTDLIGKAFEYAIQKRNVRVIQLLTTHKNTREFLTAGQCAIGLASIVKKLQEKSLTSPNKEQYKEARNTLVHYTQRFTDNDLQQACSKLIKDVNIRQPVLLLLSRRYNSDKCSIL